MERPSNGETSCLRRFRVALACTLLVACLYRYGCGRCNGLCCRRRGREDLALWHPYGRRRGLPRLCAQRIRVDSTPRTHARVADSMSLERLEGSSKKNGCMRRWEQA